MLIFIFSNECEILPDYQSCHVVQIYGGRILIFYQHGMSINRLSIAPGNQTDFPSQAGAVIHRPVPD